MDLVLGLGALYLLIGVVLGFKGFLSEINTHSFGTALLGFVMMIFCWPLVVKKLRSWS